nr:immunoglobulin heavy chain junction region [Macaca mulatta]MOW22594.1 immunoglobulin heavy chain junction region [Macaca mulatta]MOW22602.1 immunoglobulin heavy chain junction region [Macaca mulatta]MOW22604.1 immunoglobulin heavy chain junction region [Macaca mulatta]MOW22605.1 immunoglobulin heavy chain junction region [Macaca mulatta]
CTRVRFGDLLLEHWFDVW